MNRERCQALVAGTRRRCKKLSVWRIPFSSQASVEAAVRTGWPVCYPGMIQPEMVGERHLCGRHGGMHLDDEASIRWARGFAIRTLKSGEVNKALGDPWKAIEEADRPRREAM